MDECDFNGCGELAAGICQWCLQPVCGTHSICVNGPRFLYFYLCGSCNTPEHYAILRNRVFHANEQRRIEISQKNEHHFIMGNVAE